MTTMILLVFLLRHGVYKLIRDIRHILFISNDEYESTVS